MVALIRCICILFLFISSFCYVHTFHIVARKVTHVDSIVSMSSSSSNNAFHFKIQPIASCILCGLQFAGYFNPSFLSAVNADDIDLRSELARFEEVTESEKLRTAREPKTLLQNLQRKLGTSQKMNSPVVPVRPGDKEKQIQLAAEKVLTLKAYLDEAERDLFEKNWDNLQVYLYTFAEQEDAFALLIDNIFPENNELDKTERAAMSFEAQSMFLALDDLREAARDHRENAARRAYSNLLLAYDRFLKAGDLYPTYDVITSTEIFFSGTPQSQLKFNADRKVQVLDEVVLTSGPDMGKTGTVINIEKDNAVVKLNRDGKAYQEVKYVKTKMLAVAEPDENAKGVQKKSKNL